MTLPASGQIKMTQVNAELSRPQTQTASLGESPVRSLAGRMIGTISMSHLRGKRVIPKSLSGPATAPGDVNATPVTYIATSNAGEPVRLEIQWAQNAPTVYNATTDASGNASFTHTYFFWANWLVRAFFQDGTVKSMYTMVNDTTSPIDTTKPFKVTVPATWDPNSPHLFLYSYEGAASRNLQGGKVYARNVNNGAQIITSNGNAYADVSRRGEGEVQLIMTDTGTGYIAMELRFHNAAGEYMHSELRTVYIYSSAVPTPTPTPMPTPTPTPTPVPTPPPAPVMLDGSQAQLTYAPSADWPDGKAVLRILNVSAVSYTWVATEDDGQSLPLEGSGYAGPGNNYHDFSVQTRYRRNQTVVLTLTQSGRQLTIGI